MRFLAMVVLAMVVFTRLGFAVGVDRGALDLVARAAGAPLPMGAAAGAIVRLNLGGARGTLLLVDQRLPVGHRDLIVVGVDFAKARKPWRLPP